MREGKSLGAWLREAADEKLAASGERRIASAEDLERFFARCDARDGARTGRAGASRGDRAIPQGRRRPAVTFVDTNVFVYAVGGEHPLRARGRVFLTRSIETNRPLVTSAEVLQELLHAYLPVDRTATLDAAMTLAEVHSGLAAAFGA